MQGNRPKADSSLFDDLDDEGGADDLFAKPKETGKKKPPGGVALFGDADVFGSPPKKEPEKPPENKVGVVRWVLFSFWGKSIFLSGIFEDFLMVSCHVIHVLLNKE